MTKPWLLGGALLLSLAANLFMAGWLVGRPHGHTSSEQIEAPDRHGLRLKHLMAKLEKLPPEQRSAVRQLLREYSPQLHELGKRNKLAHQALQEQITQPELPRAALEASFARQRELQNEMQTLMQQMLLDIAEQLPPEQRVMLLKRNGR